MPENEVKNISYYDGIAHDYDALMDEAGSNAIVRKKVSDEFLRVVAPGSRILDFGGGTGADLEWTIGHYQVIFCEPSAGMKEQAMGRYRESGVHGRIDFLSGASADFTGWAEQLPFRPVDAILANFAVINCIRDIELLFSSLALALRPGGDLMALMLRPRMRHELRSFAGLGTSTTDIGYKGHQQTVYNHSLTGIRRAAGKRFHFSGSQLLSGSIFSLIHLTRK